jgi:hypothetical protein
VLDAEKRGAYRSPKLKYLAFMFIDLWPVERGIPILFILREKFCNKRKVMKVSKQLQNDGRCVAWKLRQSLELGS